MYNENNLNLYALNPVEILELFFFPNCLSIGYVGRVFANGPGDRHSIPGLVIPNIPKNATWCFSIRK